MIPEANDSPAEIEQLTDWILGHLGPDIPLHFTAFHPDFKMMDRGPTPAETLFRAQQIAYAKGLHYVYTGNVHDAVGSSTYCPECRKLIVERDWYALGDYNIKKGNCAFCQAPIPGHFYDVAGTWGAKRMPVSLSEL